jgi:hypothetical protein
MRIRTALILAAATAAIALPASAQTYQRNCANTKNSSQLGGAVVGSIIGGVLGNNIASNGHRADGTTVGAVLGGLVGAGVGGSSVRCDPVPLPPPPGTYAPGYSNQYGSGYGYQQQPYGYSPAPAGAYPVDPGYSGYGHGNDGYYDRDVDPYGNSRLYGDGYGSYSRNDDYAGRDCSTATQITRLPDGTVIRRPVEACRDAYYGDWQVRN